MIPASACDLEGTSLVRCATSDLYVPRCQSVWTPAHILCAWVSLSEAVLDMLCLDALTQPIFAAK